jgi:hypothetical protein
MKITKIIIAHLLILLNIVSFAETNADKDSLQVSLYASTISNKKLSDDSSKEELRHLEFGLRYMPTFSSIDVHAHDGRVINGSVTMSQGFGIMTALNLTKHLGVQAEVNYYQITQKYADRTFNNDLTINYLNIPVLLSLNTNKEARVNFNIVAGPQFGFNLGSKFTSSGTDPQDSTKAVVALRKGDVGVAYGAGFEFALNQSHTFRLDVGYRGFYGLVNMDATTSQSGTYNVIVSTSRKTYGGYLGLAWMF